MVTNVPFDENDPKYKCCFKRVHVRLAARIVSVALVASVLVNILFSLSRSSTVLVYALVSASFAVGIYGSLAYAVFKEKKIFTMPFLLFQAVAVMLNGLLFLSFLICAMFSSSGLVKLAEDFGGLDPKADPHVVHDSLRGFVVVAIIMLSMGLALNLWFLEIIYRFYRFLEDRESSFNFNLDTDVDFTRVD
ncbi:Protein C39D10.6 [Aphelenchoides avenae]|nr:Protein C39D10.6 [Aphelenchus avenae]